mgnify:CR=1 FL=1
MFAVDDLAVSVYVENTAAADNQLRLDPQSFLDCGRQTGGLGKVVSYLAVSDADIDAHAFSPTTASHNLILGARPGADNPPVGSTIRVR